MYTEQEWTEAKKTAVRREWTAILPGAVIVAAAIVIFIIGQNNRSENAWLLTALLTIVGVGFYLFWHGVYAKPMWIYAKHIQYMLHGRKRVTEGRFKSFTEEICDRDGLSVHAMMVNIGSADEDEDDRLFYFDAMKPEPKALLGKRVRVTSNDKMVAALEEI